MEPITFLTGTDRERLFQEVRHRFSELYPFLTIEAVRKTPIDRASPAQKEARQARDLLHDIGLSDDMNVADLEIALEQWFGHPIQVLRKNGHSWMETRLTRAWTIQQQNEQGRNIANGFD